MTPAQPTGFRNSIIGKAILFVPLGVFFGLWLELALVWSDSPLSLASHTQSQGLRDLLNRIQAVGSCPLVGPLAGFVMVLVIALVAAERDVPAFARLAAVGATIGVLGAVFLAAMVYPEIGVARVRDSGRFVMPTAWSEIRYRFVIEGLRYSIPVGLFLGGVGGMWVHVTIHSHRAATGSSIRR